MSFTQDEMVAALKQRFEGKFVEGKEPMLRAPKREGEVYGISMPFAPPYLRGTVGITETDLSRPIEEVVDEVVKLIEASAPVKQI